MQYRADSLGLSGGVTQVFRDLIHQRLGLFYDIEQFDLVADRLAPLIVARGMGSFMDYYYFLKYGEEPDEWSRVMDALAVHETYFWREVDQLRALVNCVVPQLAENGTTPLRIWSVPCASGEEPLTLAMLLDQSGWFDRLPIEIVGSDASPFAIARAREGVYGQRSFRNLPPAVHGRGRPLPGSKGLHDATGPRADRRRFGLYQESREGDALSRIVDRSGRDGS